MPHSPQPAPAPHWPPATPSGNAAWPSEQGTGQPGHGCPPPFPGTGFAPSQPGFPPPVANAHPLAPPSYPAPSGWPDSTRNTPAASWPPPSAMPPSIPPGPAPAASGHPGPAQPPPRAAEMDFALLAAVDHAMADLRAAVNAPQPAAGSLSELLRGIANATTPSPFSPDQR